MTWHSVAHVRSVDEESSEVLEIAERSEVVDFCIRDVECLELSEFAQRSKRLNGAPGDVESSEVAKIC